MIGIVSLRIVFKLIHRKFYKQRPVIITEFAYNLNKPTFQNKEDQEGRDQEAPATEIQESFQSNHYSLDSDALYEQFENKFAREESIQFTRPLPQIPATLKPLLF